VEILARRIKEFREDLDMQQKVLSIESGVPQATISRLESGKIKDPRLSTIYKIAEALNTGIEDLLF